MVKTELFARSRSILAIVCIAIICACASNSFAQTSGYIYTYSGNGSSGSGPDGGLAVNTASQLPVAVVSDSSGNIFYVEDPYAAKIRRVDASTKTISTVAGNGTSGYSGDGGPAINAEFNQPRGLAIDSAGNIYVADTNNRVVRKIDTSGNISTIVSFSVLCTSCSPWGVAINPANGNLYMGSLCEVYELVPSGGVYSVVGNGSCYSTGDGGPATSAEIDGTGAIAFDPSGNLFVSDYYKVRRVDVGTGIISTFAGTGTHGLAHNGDGGPATSANLGAVQTLAADASGNVFIGDDNYTVQKVTSSTGIISTITGSSTAGYSGDGGPAVNAEIGYAPDGLALDPSGNLYLADFSNNRVRVVYH